MTDHIYYKMPKDHEYNSNSNSSSSDGYPYTFDGRSFIAIKSTGSQVIIFLPEELYPDQK